TEAPPHQDRLYEATVFEAFLAAPASDRYIEYNFAPSAHYCAYAFEAYRTPSIKGHFINGPLTFAVAVKDKTLELRVTIAWQKILAFLGNPRPEDLLIGVS